MADYLRDVAIIGAGLGGCALALALAQEGVPIKIFESRPDGAKVIPSGVVLTPNGLRMLDHLGVFDRIKDRCYITHHRVFKNDKDESIKVVPLGGPQEHGYWNHRIWRSKLLDEMKLMLKERGIEIAYNSKFDSIISDDSNGVTYLINDQPRLASLLIGSDGINSSVRKYLAPGIEPEYTGLLGLISHIKWDSVDWPYPDYERNATIQGKPGAIFWTTEEKNGNDIMIGYQMGYPELSKTGLRELDADKDKLAELYRTGYDEHGPTAKSIIDSVCNSKDTLYTWPFMKMPKLPRWFSETGRVILCGDGAHALPPSSGQGVNQALEDIYSLTLLLTAVGGGSRQTSEVNSNGIKTNGTTSEPVKLLDALAFWQQMRQERIDAVFNWTVNSNNVSRLPEAERKKLIDEGKVKPGDDDTSWLFRFDVKEAVNEWLQSR